MPSKQVEDVYNAGGFDGSPLGRPGRKGTDAVAKDSWQVEQGARCPCRGSDEYCGCQNNMPGIPQAIRYKPYGGAGELPVECCKFSVVDSNAGKEVCRCWTEEDARHIAFRMNLNNPTADVLDEAVKALEYIASGRFLSGETPRDACQAAINRATSTLAKIKGQTP